MHIKKIKICNFRNYLLEEIEFSNFSNLILGDNAQGKTNLLEAIYFVCNGKTFKNNFDNELLNYKISNDLSYNKYFKIFIEYEKNNRNQNIEVIVKSDRKKQIKKNGVVIKKIQELLGSLNVILFNPDDLKIIKYSPNDRRKFLDRELSNIYVDYLIERLEYNKILEQKNKLLKSYFSKEIYKNNDLKNSFDIELDIWNEKLLKLNIKLLIKRMDFIEKINLKANKIHQFISDDNEEVKVVYTSNLDSKIYERYLELKKTSSYLEIEELFYKNYKKMYDLSKDIDIKQGNTKYGIHKDDFVIYINGKEARKYSSQGQQRTAILAIKISELEIIKEENQECPILLLDDVMSELDEKRQTLLINKINEFQSIITSTDVKKLELKKLKPYRQIVIKNGNVLENIEINN